MTTLTRTTSLLSLALLACTAESPPANDSKAKTEPPKTEPLPEVSTVNPQADPVPKPIPAQDGFFMAEGAPMPRACTAKSDCLGDTIPDLENPCCNNPRTLEPYAWAYREWMNGWRKDNCAAIECPPPPAPSMPPACAFDVDCVDGSCVDACD